MINNKVVNIGSKKTFRKKLLNEVFAGCIIDSLLSEPTCPQVLILSTKSLLKRMMAVARTLEAIDHVALARPAPSACELRTLTNDAEEWLHRTN